VEPAPPPEPVALARRPRARDGGWWGAALTACAAVAVVALLGATAAGRELSAPPAPLTVVVLFLPYGFAALATLVFALWAAIPDRRLPPALLAVLAVVGVVRWGPRWVRPAPDQPDDVRVLTWNIQRLWGDAGQARASLGCVVDAVRTADPDVATFLEISGEDLPALEEALGMRCAHSPYFAGGGPRTGGLAACVRRDGWTVRGAGQRFVDSEDWSYVFAEVQRGSDVFNLLAVHLVPYRITERDLRRSLDDLVAGRPATAIQLRDRSEQIVRAQADQSAALLERVARLRDPTVIAGDFNSTRDTALHVQLRSHLTDTWEQVGRGFGGTIRAFDHIPLRIDYIYASDAFAPRAAQVPSVPCSDHLPVVADLSLAAPR